MVVEPGDGRARERLRHDDAGRAVAAAHVGDPPAGLEPCLHPVEGGDPLADEVHGVARTEEPLAALVDPGIVLVPAHAGAGAERIRDLRLVANRADAQLKRPRQVRVEQQERVLRRQREAAARRVVGDVAARGLRGQPLAHVPLARAGALGQLRRSQRAGAGHRPVQAELVADEHETRVERGRDVGDRLAEELLHLRVVQRGLLG